jgi:putative peptidoglycan lipid II flippase
MRPTPTSPNAADSPRANGGADIVGRHQRLVARTVLISAFTALSRVLGYAREFLTAVLFGDVSPVYDAFVTAWRVPNLFRRLLGEGAVSMALQTSMTEADADQGDDAGRVLMWDTLRLATWLLVGVCAVVMGTVQLVPDALNVPWSDAPAQWLGEDPAAVRDLTYHVMPYVIVICLAGLIGGALSVRGKFTAASAGPGVMNVVAIVTLLAIGWKFGWTGLDPSDGLEGRERHYEMAKWFSWGLVLSGVAQLAMLAPEMRSAGLLHRTKAAVRSSTTAWTVLRTSVPLTLGAAVYQINVLVDSFMAQGMLPRGGPTAYYYANRLQQLPMALVAVAATSAVFPALKALAHRRDFAELKRVHSQTHLGILFVTLPAAAGLYVLATPVTACLLQYGEFGAEGVARTADALRYLCLALVPAGAVGLLSRAYYALGDFSTPVRLSLVALVLNIVFNTLFLAVWELDTGGLALSTAIVSALNVAMLAPGLRKRLAQRGDASGAGLPDFRARLLKMSCAAILCGAVAWGAYELISRGERSIAGLIVAIGSGMAVYFGAAQLFELPEWVGLRAKLRRRLER